MFCLLDVDEGAVKMTFKVVKELQKIDATKKCGLLTCAHYAGGYCVGCENDNECEFIEKSYTQD